MVRWYSSFKRRAQAPLALIFLKIFYHLEDSVVTSAVKASGAVHSACRSAFALPISRAVSVHSALVTPLATLNCIAWFPLVQQGGPWSSKMNDQWFWLLGFEPRPSKEFLLLREVHLRLMLLLISMLMASFMFLQKTKLAVKRTK